MTMVTSEAAIRLPPFSGEIGSHRTVGRRSSRRLRLPSAVTVRLAGLSRLRERHGPHTHGDRKGRLGYEPASDSNRQPREAKELPGTTSGWSPRVQKSRDTCGQDPEGGVPREREAPQPPRSGGQGGWYPRVSLGDGEALLAARGRNARPRQRAVSLREKGEARTCVRPIYGAGAYNQYTETQTQLVFASGSD
jgi:hypothetical protein